MRGSVLRLLCRLAVPLGGAAAVTVGIADDKTSSSAAWKKQVFGNYENRIREMSAPEKVFQYFASVKQGSEWFMTPQDFMRSILPFNKIGSSSFDVPPAFARVMNIADPNGDGLISFSEYVFFTSLMSIPRKYFNVAFRIMDRNGDNKVDAEEFQRVMNVVQSHNPLQVAARTPVADGSLLKGWFGEDGKKTLSLDEFKRFLNDLHGSVREVFFASLDHDKDGFIDAQEFALSLVNFASFKDLPRFQQRVENITKSSLKVSLKEFMEWKDVIEQIDEIDRALSLFDGEAGGSTEFTTDQLKRAIFCVTGIQSKDEHLAVILTVFDDDGNGKLSRTEFGDVLRKAASCGFTKPRDLGFVRLASCCASCISDAMSSKVHQ